MAAILADDIFKCILLNENVRILIKISLKFVPKGPINNTSALVQVMAWRRIGDKPLPEPLLTQFTWRIYAALGGDELIKIASQKIGYLVVIAICWNGGLDLYHTGPEVICFNYFNCQRNFKSRNSVLLDIISYLCKIHINGWVQYCSVSIANELEILQMLNDNYSCS